MSKHLATAITNLQELAQSDSKRRSARARRVLAILGEESLDTQVEALQRRVEELRGPRAGSSSTLKDELTKTAVEALRDLLRNGAEKARAGARRALKALGEKVDDEDEDDDDEASAMSRSMDRAMGLASTKLGVKKVGTVLHLGVPEDWKAGR